MCCVLCLSVVYRLLCVLLDRCVFGFVCWSLFEVRLLLLVVGCVLLVFVVC